MNLLWKGSETNAEVSVVVVWAEISCKVYLFSNIWEDLCSKADESFTQSRCHRCSQPLF